MELLSQIGLAGLIAGFLTYCDLATVFDAPPPSLEWRPWLRLNAWWWTFVLGNGVLGAALFSILRGTYFKDLNAWLAALIAGFSYTAIVRLQFTTLPINGKNTAVGIETGYEALKNLVHRRINRVVRLWRMEQCKTLALSSTADLRQQALLMANTDALMSNEDRNAVTAWVNQVADDDATPDADRRMTLAVYIITERRSAT